MSEPLTPAVVTYRGRPVTELSREELIEAYTRVCLDLKAQRQADIDNCSMEQLFADIACRVRT